MKFIRIFTKREKQNTVAWKTAREYVESLHKMNPHIYMFGEKVENRVGHPIIRPSINCVSMTYALAQEPSTRPATDKEKRENSPGQGNGSLSRIYT